MKASRLPRSRATLDAHRYLPRLRWLPPLVLGWIVLVLSFLAPLRAEEQSAVGWNQWAGPHRSGSVSAGWSQQGAVRLVERWRRPSDGSISAPVIVAGQVFFQRVSAEGQEVVALDLDSGKQRWQTAVGLAPENLEYGAPTTVAANESRVVALSGDCRLKALAAATGEVLWEHRLIEDFGAELAGLGCWSSPLLVDGQLVVQVNAPPQRQLMAFDITDGGVLWQRGGVARASHSAAGYGHLGNVPQLILHGVAGGRGSIHGLRWRDGELLWTHVFDDPGSYSADTPVVVGPDSVAVLTWNDLRLLSIRAEKGEFRATEAWQSTAVAAGLQPINLHFVARGEHLYGFAADDLSCLARQSGEVLWRERIYPGSLVAAGEDLVIVSRAAGKVRLVAAQAEGYRERAALDVFPPGAPVDAPPSVAGSFILLRSSEELVALEVVDEPRQLGDGGAS